MKKYSLAGIAGLALAVPGIAFAQTTSGSLIGIVNQIGAILDLLVPIVITLALIYFIYGVAKYIMSSGDEEGQKAARGIMIWGIIGLFVIVSIWGIVGLIASSLGVTAGATITLPSVP